jgi:hypothetical protein
MKRNCLSTVLVTALVLAGLLSAPRARAGTDLHIDVQMGNVLWAPAAGTLNWLSPWELEASTAIFDSQNGFTNGYQFQAGQPAIVAASAATPLMTAGSRAAVNAAGNIVSPQSSLDQTVSQGVTLTAFSAATAYREFEITGGAGPVAVNFGFDYSGLFQNTGASGYGMDYMALLRISDGVSQWDLMAYASYSGLGTYPFGGTLSQLFTLQYDTPYSISLITETETPEPKPVQLLTLGIALWASRQLFKAKAHGKQAVAPDTGRV